jgi:hypothetical protein
MADVDMSNGADAAGNKPERLYEIYSPITQ